MSPIRFDKLSKSEIIHANARLLVLAKEFEGEFGYPHHLQRFLHCEEKRIETFNQSAEPRTNLMGSIWG